MKLIKDVKFTLQSVETKTVIKATLDFDTWRNIADIEKYFLNLGYMIKKIQYIYENRN